MAWLMQDCAGGTLCANPASASSALCLIVAFPTRFGLSHLCHPQASMLPRLLELVLSSWVVCSQRTPRTPRGFTQSRDNSNSHRKSLPGSRLMEIKTAHCLGARGCLCPTPETSGCGTREGSRSQIKQGKDTGHPLCLAQAQGPLYPLCM